MLPLQKVADQFLIDILSFASSEFKEVVLKQLCTGKIYMKHSYIIAILMISYLRDITALHDTSAIKYGSSYLMVGTNPTMTSEICVPLKPSLGYVLHK